MSADLPGPGAPEEPDPVCASCDRPGSLVRARRLLQAAELENSESMLGRDAWFHRAHVPLGWRVVDFDPDETQGLPPDVPTI